MLKSCLFLFAIAATTIGVRGQSLPKMVEIPGGSFIMGGGYQYENRDFLMYLLGRDLHYDSLNAGRTAIGEVPQSNNGDRTVTVSTFFIAETEVSNLQYRDFLLDSLLDPSEKEHWQALGKKKAFQNDPDAWHTATNTLFVRAAEAGLLPDTACWTKDFRYSYNDPIAQNYFRHPAFDEYPVVGVSWKQARIYCQWLSRTNNAERARRKLPPQPDFRLPTEAEWEYAAKAPQPINSEASMAKTLYPWPGQQVLDEKGRYQANIKTGNGDYHGDGYMYTAPVKEFEANRFGLYHMAGNVAEWTEDVFRLVDTGDRNPDIRPDYGSIRKERNPRVVKGGSWADFRFAAMCGSRTAFYEEQGSSRVGFRVAMIKTGGM